MKKIISSGMAIVCMCLALCSCQKDFLGAKPGSAIVQPHTLSDFSSLMENSILYNCSGGLPQLASDEYYYLSYAGWQAANTSTERQSYLWGKDVYGGDVDIKDWEIPYQAIFYANNVLEGIDALNDSLATGEYRFVKGWAYFVRAYSLYDLVRNYGPAYDSATASIDLGVPLKLKAGIDNIEKRASVKSTFDRILSDLQIATSLLPAQYPAGHLNHPSKIAAYALFARIYLYMRSYHMAGLYADSSLRLYNNLIDYNTVSSSSRFPFSGNQSEAIYTTSQVIAYPSTTIGSNARLVSMDTGLLKLYGPNDLRYAVYFQNGAKDNTIMRGGYYGTGLYAFTGLAVDEMYLIRAESAAREGRGNSALSDLNTLLLKRYKSGSYQLMTDANAGNALDRVLEERRKELVWRSLRWGDLKRLNKEGANIVLTRFLNGQKYTLAPNDPRYVFNIPSDEILLSGIPQNER